MIDKVIKRDGRIVDFDQGKVLAAVEKSMKAAGHTAPQGAAAVAEAVTKRYKKVNETVIKDTIKKDIDVIINFIEQLDLDNDLFKED